MFFTSSDCIYAYKIIKAVFICEDYPAEQNIYAKYVIHAALYSFLSSPWKNPPTQSMTSDAMLSWGIACVWSFVCLKPFKTVGKVTLCLLFSFGRKSVSATGHRVKSSHLFVSLSQFTVWVFLFSSSHSLLWWVSVEMFQNMLTL